MLMYIGEEPKPRSDRQEELYVTKEGPGDYDSTDKLYVAINWTDVDPKSGKCGGTGKRITPEIELPVDHHWGTVTVHRRVTEIKYEMTRYHIYGSKIKEDGNDPCPAESFLTALEEFVCFEKQIVGFVGLKKTFDSIQQEHRDAVQEHKNGSAGKYDALMKPFLTGAPLPP
eukprot:GHVU01101686.1.p4 GENE.GHVU01101686.1~~GHVU01101686.1.p4  ORF type:complete len:171 (-),score=31.89 GHVU01101686.1:154-666(-)